MYKVTGKHRWASPFIPFANRELSYISSSTNGKNNKFLFACDEPMVDGLRKINWASVSV
jgi:hypothetical protein